MFSLCLSSFWLLTPRLTQPFNLIMITGTSQLGVPINSFTSFMANPDVTGLLWSPSCGQIATVRRARGSVHLQNAIVRMVKPISGSLWECMILRFPKESSWIGCLPINLRIDDLELASWAEPGLVRTYSWCSSGGKGALQLHGNGNYTWAPLPDGLFNTNDAADSQWWKIQNRTLILGGPPRPLLFEVMGDDKFVNTNCPMRLLNPPCGTEWLVLLSTLTQ